MAIPKRIKIERVYVKVASEFDSTGYMQPTSITWADGRTFPIETVRDFRPAGTADNDCNGDCFTVLIQGQEKHLFRPPADWKERPISSPLICYWMMRKCWI